MLPTLLIDKSSITERKQAEWNNYGLEAVRAESMQQGIELLSRNSNYLFICINADNINYMPLLNVMRGITILPIFIGTSHFNVSDQVEALQNGADSFASFHDNAKDNILSALAMLHSFSERSKRPIRKVIFHDNLFVVYSYRKAFYNGIEIQLTKKEFELLYILMKNRGCVLTYKQVYRKVWGLGYDDSTHSILWNHVLNLRKKLSVVAGNDGFIENVWDVGYRISTDNNKKDNIIS